MDLPPSPASLTSDPVELAKFHQLAETWWDPKGPMWPLHAMNAFRMTLIMETLSQWRNLPVHTHYPLSGLQILDVGCGGGILSESLARLGADVTGIDPVKRNIDIARQHAQQQNLTINYRHTDVENIEETFDLVFNMEVVEHVANLKSFMCSLNHNVRPGGLMFVSTINKTLKSYVFAILAAEYILRLLPVGTHDWNKFVSPETIKLFLNQGRFDVMWTKGLTMNPFTRRFRLTRSTQVNYIVTAKKTEF